MNVLLASPDFARAHELDKLLGKFLGAGLRPLVLGGYLRDRVLGLEPRDIDVFVHADRNAVMGLFGMPVTHPMDGDYDGSGGMEWPRLRRNIAFEVMTFGVSGYAQPVQVMATADPFSPADLVRRGDFGVNQIAYDGRLVYRTQAFDNDMAHRQLVMRHNHTPRPCRQRRTEDLAEHLGLAGFNLRHRLFAK
ncbi:MAG TPA: hypothetical protein VHP58_02785 [Alphaproteobacteria bacterium]|nr:hypothetical protein [Alphaproteobacteria bacterium]